MNNKIKEQDTELLKAIIKGYVNKYNIKEMKIDIMDLYDKKKVDVRER